MFYLIMWQMYFNYLEIVFWNETWSKNIYILNIQSFGIYADGCLQVNFIVTRYKTIVPFSLLCSFVGHALDWIHPKEVFLPCILEIAADNWRVSCTMKDTRT